MATETAQERGKTGKRVSKNFRLLNRLLFPLPGPLGNCSLGCATTDLPVGAPEREGDKGYRAYTAHGAQSAPYTRRGLSWTYAKSRNSLNCWKNRSVAEIEIHEGEESVRISRPDGRLAPPAVHPPPACDGVGSRACGCRAERPLSRLYRPGTPSPRPWSAPSTSRSSPGAKPFVEIGQAGECRRHAVHHRSDEDAQPDRGRQGRHRFPRSWSRTVSRSNTGSPCS